MLNLLSGSSLSIKVSKQLDWWTWLSILASPQTIYFPIGRSDKVFGIAAPLRGLNLNNSTTGSSRWSINGALFRGTRSYSNLKKNIFWWKQYKYPECPPTMRYNQTITQFAIMQSANEGQNFWTNWPKQKLKACMNLIIVIVLGFWGLMMSSMEWGSVLLSERSGWFSSLITWVLLNVYACHVLLFSSEKIFSNVKSRGWL